MMRIKKDYESPSLSVRRIEMESGFCSASADIKNPNDELGRIDDQGVNKDFGSDSFDESGWSAN